MVPARSSCCSTRCRSPPNGKVDRRALPAPEPSARERRVRRAPRTPAEELVAGVWAERARRRAGRRRTTTSSSSAATRCWPRRSCRGCARRFGVDLPLARALRGADGRRPRRRVDGRAVRRRHAVGAAACAGRRATGPLPLSFAQQRLWFLDQLEPGSAAYNIPGAVRLPGHLDVAALGAQPRPRSCAGTRRCAPSSRRSTGEPRQLVDAGRRGRASRWSISAPCRGRARRARPSALARRGRAARPFDLARGPLFRAPGCCGSATDDHVLLARRCTTSCPTAGRWACSSASSATLYEAFCGGRPSPLPALPVQYADFAVWQRQWLRGRACWSAQLAYWREQLADAPPLLELPTDRPRPARADLRGARARELVLPAERRRRRCGRCAGAGRDAVHDAAGGVPGPARALHAARTTSSSARRSRTATRVEIEGLIGFFVNTLVLRTDLSGDPTFRELARARSARSTLDAYAHQDVPFEQLVEELQPERDLSRTPAVPGDVRCCRTARAVALRMPGLAVRAARRADHGDGEVRSRRCHSPRTPSGLAGRCEYSTDLFDAATIARLVGHFEQPARGGARAIPTRRRVASCRC